MSTQTITPTSTNDHIHRGQDESENGPLLGLESVSQGVWHCVAQPFQNAAQRCAKLPGRPILRQLGAIFRFILASVCMVIGSFNAQFGLGGGESFNAQFRHVMPEPPSSRKSEILLGGALHPLFWGALATRVAPEVDSN